MADSLGIGVAFGLGSQVVDKATKYITYFFTGDDPDDKFDKYKEDANQETRRHDFAMEGQQKAIDKWNKQRTQRIDFANEQTKRETHAVTTFNHVDQKSHEYKLKEDAFNTYNSIHNEDEDEDEISENLIITLGIIIGIIYFYKKR